MLGFFRKFACFSRTENVVQVQENGEDDGELVENIPAPVPAVARTVSSNIDIPIPPERANWWLSDQVPTRPSAKMGHNRLHPTGLGLYVNEVQKVHEMVPLSRRTTEDVRSDDSSIALVSTDSQAGSDLQEEVPQQQNATNKDPPAILGSTEQTAAPRATLIKIGIIVRSPDGSIPRVIPLNPPQNVQSSEVLVKAALFYEEGRQGNSTCESHIFYNTQSGKIELNSGHFEQEYII